MNINLLSLAQEALGGDFSKLAGQFLGESAGTTQTALTSLLPTVIGAIAQKGATPAGATSLISLINGSNLDTSALGNLAGLFSGSGAGNLIKAGAGSLLPALFGNKAGALADTLSSVSGLKGSSATNLLAMVVPLALTMLKKVIGDRGLNAGGLSALLAGQAPHLRSAIDSRLAGALGFPSAGAFLSGVGSTVASTGAAAAATATKSGMWRWLPWLLGLAALALIWNFISGKPQAPVAVPAATAPAPAAAAPAVVPVLPAKIFFDVGAATFGAEGSKTIAAVAESLKKSADKVTITGYTDKTGNMETNQALAKSRAGAVRDALKAAGIAEANLEMRPPLFVEVGAAGSDAEARRVEIVKQ